MEASLDCESNAPLLHAARSRRRTCAHFEMVTKVSRQVALEDAHYAGSAKSLELCPLGCRVCVLLKYFRYWTRMYTDVSTVLLHACLHCGAAKVSRRTMLPSSTSDKRLRYAMFRCGRTSPPINVFFPLFPCGDVSPCVP